MATLTSTHKEHLDNILDGIKKIEWRKKPLPLGKHYGYETKNKGGCGKVTGEFEVVENVKVTLGRRGITYDYPKHFIGDFLDKGCVPFEFLVKYANGEEYLYANIIENPKRYDKPKELSEFKRWVDRSKGQIYFEDKLVVERPPQSYMKVEELKED